jgi:hypothetical protein
MTWLPLQLKQFCLRPSRSWIFFLSWSKPLQKARRTHPHSTETAQSTPRASHSLGSHHTWASSSAWCTSIYLWRTSLSNWQWTIASCTQNLIVSDSLSTVLFPCPLAPSLRSRGSRGRPSWRYCSTKVNWETDTKQVLLSRAPSAELRALSPWCTRRPLHSLSTWCFLRHWSKSGLEKDSYERNQLYALPRRPCTSWWTLTPGSPRMGSSGGTRPPGRLHTQP